MQDLAPAAELAGRYRLIRKLGEGGNAAVWLADDRLAGKPVALKIVSEAAADALSKEWQTGLRLMHAHIVRVFEFHTDDGVAFYSLQHLAGPDLAAASGQPADIVLGLIGGVADALRYAHGKHCVHGDIKASNVLLDANGSPAVVDFGNAAAGSLSLATCSPQQLSGEPTHPSDDIYALGVLTYELLEGRSPYGDQIDAEAVRSQAPAPLQRASGLPRSVQALLANMLSKAADQRPSAEQVAAALRDAGFGPRAWAAGVSAPAALPADEVIETRRASRPDQRKVRSELPQAAASGLRPNLVWAALAVLVIALIGVVFLLPERVNEVPEPTAQAAADEAPAEQEQTESTSTPAFSENRTDLSGRDERVQDRDATDKILGQLLSKLQTLDSRAVQRWGGLPYQRAQARYEEGDAAYLDRDYATASERYKEAIEIVDPLLEQVDAVFDATYSKALEALENGDTVVALEQFELAVAISPSSAAAQAGLERAENLDQVLAMTDSGLALENSLEYDRARDRFAAAIALDPAWQPAIDGLARVNAAIEENTFAARMSEGIAALNQGDMASARAAFRVAQSMRPSSAEAADGLLQVELATKLQTISRLENTVAGQVADEDWAAALTTYEELLEIDPNLEFALRGQATARDMLALHEELDGYLARPDTLSAAATMQRATNFVVGITRMESAGPRLQAKRDRLSQLLRRAATPLTVQLVSDNATEVSIFKVARLGTFDRHELELRPGTYVAVGSRVGYRDVRLEFRVAPEVDMQPIVIRCEEPI